MIKINLLPLDKIVPEKTPLPRLMLIFVSAAASAIIIAVVAALFLQIRLKNSELADLKKKRDALRTDVEIYKAEKAKTDRTLAKIKEIDSVIERPIEWWRTVDALWDVIHANPKIWIDDIKIMDDKAVQSAVKKADPDAKMPFPPYGVIVKCHAAGFSASDMTQFRMALKRNAVLKKTLPNINFNPDWKTDDEKDYEEGASMSFEVALYAPVQAPVQMPKPVPGKP